MKQNVGSKTNENTISKELASTNLHIDNIDETNEIIGLAVPMDMKNVSKNTSNISNVSNENTSRVDPDIRCRILDRFYSGTIEVWES